MTREDLVAVQKRLRDSGWSGNVTLENRDVQRLPDEIRWLKSRLQRVEFAIGRWSNTFAVRADADLTAASGPPLVI